MNKNFSGGIWGICKKILPQRYEIPVLIYHSIGSNSMANESFPIDLLKRHFDFFKKNEYNVISINELINLIKENKKIVSSTVCLTFDDGYEDGFNVVYPVLKEYRFPALMFVVVNKIGQNEHLKLDQIKLMAAEGLISIGSHSMNHYNLLSLNEEQLFIEITESKKILEEKLGRQIDFFAYPWGAFSAQVMRIVKQSGYRAAFSTNSKIGRNLGENNDIYALKRMTMAKQDNKFKFLIKVSGFGGCFARKIKYSSCGQLRIPV
jgi:peptidoglycan/xylan/chitin deacetylase (PgdA/CDA1 family)